MPTHAGRVATVLAGALLTIAGAARANGRLPGANRIVLSPSNPNLVVVRATYGILPSFNRGATWSLLCEDDLGLPALAAIDPALGLTATNALVVGLAPEPTGLDVSTDTGCTWKCIGGPLAGQAIVDIAVRPNAADSVVALTSTFFSNDAGGGWFTQPFESKDDGATWAAFGTPVDSTVQVTTIDVAPSNPQRLYVSGTGAFGSADSATLFVSSDGGATWTAHPVPASAAPPIYIAGVDPQDADRVYIRNGARENTEAASKLLVSTDAGESFQVALSFTGLMQGFALSPDGSKIYAGGQTDGFYVGDSATLKFTKKSDLPVECLATRGDELWACSDDAPGRFLAGVSTDEGATFVPKLHLSSLNGPIECGSGGAGFACGTDAGGGQCSGSPFEQICSALGCEVDGGSKDAGASDAGPAADAGAPHASKPASSSSCGCTVAGLSTSGSEGAALAGLLAMATALRTRRRS